MSNTNFVVETGLQVGPLTIFAGNGDVITTGNVSFTGAAIDQFDAVTANSITVTGNLTVLGTQTSVNSQTLNITDLSMTLANGAVSSAAADGAGFDIAGAGVEFRWNSTEGHMALNRTLSYDTAPNLNMSANSIQPKYYVDVMAVVFGT
jgi:hypothetical protein